MKRHQQGQLYEASGAFFVRCYHTEVKDGNTVRVRIAHRLCPKNEKYYAVNCRAVKLLRDEFMLTVNAGVVDGEDLQITAFWKQTYLPYVKENLRASTSGGYEHIWKHYLEDHFAGRTLREYRTHEGSEFLTRLAKDLGRNTLAHIRSLASGIFTHAINRGLLEHNPWRDVKILTKVRAPGNTPHYTLEEAEDIIRALVEHPDAQLIMALGFFVGLRPSEIAGLKWEDLDTGYVHIRRGVVRGKVAETKTAWSQASLPLAAPVRVLLTLWHGLLGRPAGGWVFQNRGGSPADLRELARRVIRPVLEKSGLAWKGYYANRRGAGTVMVDLTGSLVAAQELLRHKSLTTTALHYKKQTQNALPNGIRLLEAAAGKKEGHNG